MKNRILLLCLKNGLETVEEFAAKVGVDDELARDILECKCIVPVSILNDCAKLFDVSVDYILCNE